MGNNSKGEKVTIKAHGGLIDIQGVTVAKVDDKVRLQSVDTWFDPMEMFRQIVGSRGEDVIVRTAVSTAEKEDALVQESVEKAAATEKKGEKNLDGSESVVTLGAGESKVEVSTDGSSGCPFFNKE